MKIRIKVMIPLLVCILLLGISFIWLDARQRREGVRESVSRTASVFEKIIESELRAKIGVMEVALTLLARDPALSELLHKMDRDKIVAYTLPIFSKLKQKNSISHFYFHRPDRVNFVRLHDLDHSGDLISRKTLLEAEATGASGFGVEQGPTGASVLRVVYPVKRGGKLQGYLELGIEFQDIVAKIEKIVGVSAFVLADKSAVKREFWEARNNKENFRSYWSFMDKQVVMASSVHSIPEELRGLKISDGKTSAYVQEGQEVSIDDRLHSVIVVPLIEAGNEKMADIVILYDSSKIRAAARFEAGAVGAVVSLIIALLAAIFYIFLGRVENVIGKQQQAIVSSSKMASLGEMAGGVAHEINNPLAIIKGTAEQMQEILRGEKLDVPMLRTMAFSIEYTTERMAKIVRGLRAFSRDGSKDASQPVNVRQLVSDTLALCAEKFRFNGVDVLIEDFDERLVVDGRTSELSQIILNLLNNAHDAILDQPSKWIKIGVVEDPRWIELRVTDSGVGIDPENREKIFQPFFTTKEVGKGTGLGLSISSGLARSHGGTLTLSSHKGHTSFDLRLPRSKA